MRRAVVHVNLDPRGQLALGQVNRAVEALRASGHDVIAGDLDKLPATRREIELLQPGDDPDDLRPAAEQACATVLASIAAAATPRAIAVSFISSGSEEDARGVVRAFGLGEQLHEVRLQDDDVAVLVLEPEALGRTMPAKLQTVLEAALNREVRFAEA
ncbi:MAG TPA: hypothetical protein VG294_10030 [Solirubrobacteraceae bacterium]|jgi:hypothetical protein|nr:hypothetical protein [Solirubrobacteraceae bacterium]